MAATQVTAKAAAKNIKGNGKLMSSDLNAALNEMRDIIMTRSPDVVVLPTRSGTANAAEKSVRFANSTTANPHASPCHREGVTATQVTVDPPAAWRASRPPAASRGPRPGQAASGSFYALSQISCQPQLPAGQGQKNRQDEI